MILADHRGSSRATQSGARNGFAEPRDRQPKSTLSRPQPAAETARTAFEPAEMPANCGLFVGDRKTSVRIGLRGGPGRTRTSNQTVMSAPVRDGQTAEPWVHRGARQPYLRSLARIGAPFVRHLVR